jgi:hypothetical protein
MPGKSHGPSIKDPDRYDALRDKGMSKEKAARISNSPRHATGVKGGKAEDYDSMRKDELLAKAKDLGLSAKTSMRKAEIIDLLRSH